MSLHDELIEAMAVALSMADPDERGLPEGKEMAPFYRELATAAYAALREKLVPVGWAHFLNGDFHSLDIKSLPRGADELGWTETPLYHLPEIEDAD